MPTPSVSKWNLKSVTVILWLSTLISYNYISLVFQFVATPWLQLHDTIIAHSAPSPYAYRLLIPESARFLSYLLEKSHPMGHHTSVIAAYCVILSVSVLFSVTMLYSLLIGLFVEWAAFAGLIIAAISMLSAYHEAQPWSLLEPGIYALGLIFALRNARYWSLPLIALATLNRETAIFTAVMIALALYRKDRKVEGFSWTAAYLFVWAAVTLGIRHYVGERPHEASIHQYFLINLHGFGLTILKSLIFLGPLWVVCLRSQARMPRQIRQAGLIFPLFVLGAAPYALWWETRLWTSFYCVLIPAIIYGLQGMITTNVLAPGSSFVNLDHPLQTRPSSTIGQAD